MNKTDLHRLVDELPENRAEAAACILKCLREEKPADELAQALLEAPDDPFLRALAAAPEDDEPETPEEREMVREALESRARGESIAWEEAKRRLFPDGL